MVEYRSRRNKTNNKRKNTNNKRKNTNKYNRYNLKGGANPNTVAEQHPLVEQPSPVEQAAPVEQASTVEVERKKYFEIPMNTSGYFESKRVGVIKLMMGDERKSKEDFNKFYKFLKNDKINSVIFGRHMFSCANAGQKYPGKALNALRWDHDPLSTFSGFVRSNIAGQILNNKGYNIKHVFASVLFRAYYTALLLCNQMNIPGEVPFNIIPYINENGIGGSHLYSDNKVDPTLWSDEGDDWKTKTQENIKNRLKKIDLLLEKRLLSFVGQEDSLGDGSFNVLDKLEFNVDPLKKIDPSNFDQKPDFGEAIKYLATYFDINLEDRSPVADSPSPPPQSPRGGGRWSGGAGDQQLPLSPVQASEGGEDVLIISHSGFIRNNLLHKTRDITNGKLIPGEKKPLNNSLWRFKADPNEMYIYVEQIFIGFDYKEHISDETDLEFCNNYNSQGSRIKIDDMRNI